MKPNAESVMKASGLIPRAYYQKLPYPRYIDYDEKTGEPQQIVCRGCGTKIAGWTDDDVVDQTMNKSTPTQVVTKLIVRQRFRRNAECQQIRAVLDTGSLYEPLVCRACAVGLVEMDALQELFDSDLVEMVAQCMATGRGTDRSIDVVRSLMPRRVLAQGGD